VEPTAPPPKPEDVEGAVPTVEMVDVYRSLVTNLKDKLGGTINDANADAIAHAAAQVYRQEVEPRLWEEKSAHELLDSLGVPRSGAFVPYSLSDRLLLLHPSDEDPYRVQAHELLDELAVPRVDGTGREYPLPTRLTLLLGSLDSVPGLTGTTVEGGGDEAPDPAEPGDVRGGAPGQARAPDDGENRGEGGGTDQEAAGPELVDALEAIQRAVGPASRDEPALPPPALPPPAPTTAPTPDLIGLGSLLGSIQEELLEVRQAVESLRQEVRDAVALIQAGSGPGLLPPVVPAVPPPDGGSEIVVRRVGDPSEAPAPDAGSPEMGSAGDGSPGAGTDFVLPDPGSPNGEGGDPGPPDADIGTPVPSEMAGPDGTPDVPVPARPVGPDEATRVLPAVPAAPDRPVFADEPVAEEQVVPQRRSRRFALLVLLVVLIGVLLAAGITAAVVLGWGELESRFLDTVTVPVWGGPGAAP
jgi:hypothetical protein